MSEQTCPFCKTQLDAEATVCHGCQAFMGIGRGGANGTVRQPHEVKAIAILFYALCGLGVILFVVALSMGGQDSWIGIALAIVGFAGGKLNGWRSENNIQWFRKQ